MSNCYRLNNITIKQIHLFVPFLCMTLNSAAAQVHGTPDQQVPGGGQHAPAKGGAGGTEPCIHLPNTGVCPMCTHLHKYIIVITY